MALVVMLVRRIEKNKLVSLSIRNIRVRTLLTETTMSVNKKMTNDLDFSVILQFLAYFFESKIPLDFLTKLQYFGHSETMKNVSHSS